MMDLTPTEYTIIEKLAHGDSESSNILKKQLEKAKVTSREFTGAGFYTKIATDDNAPRLRNNPNVKIGDIDASADGIEYGLGFLLYITDGIIDMLEGYTYGEPWPNEIRNLTVSYLDESRDLDAILYP